MCIGFVAYWKYANAFFSDCFDQLRDTDFVRLGLRFSKIIAILVLGYFGPILVGANQTFFTPERVNRYIKEV